MVTYEKKDILLNYNADSFAENNYICLLSNCAWHFTSNSRNTWAQNSASIPGVYFFYSSYISFDYTNAMKDHFSLTKEK